MSDEHWTVHAHVIPASHIRGYREGIRDEKNGQLKLAIKQYVPKGSFKTKAGGMTIVMAHGIGNSKESYEPFFDDLLGCGLTIRAIWTMDVAHHGDSYLLNETTIGDDPHWLDSSRDMLQMVNHFKELMPQPLFAIGHSWGAATIVGLSMLHPQLFSAMVLLDAPFATHPYSIGQERPPRRKDRYSYVPVSYWEIGTAMSKRRDIWASQADALEHMRAHPFYATYDPRVFERVMKYNLRPAPPNRYAEVGSPNAVTLKTPKLMEVATMMRPRPPFDGYPEEPDLRMRSSDINTTVAEGFYRGELLILHRHLPYILPSTLVAWACYSFAETLYAKLVTSRIGTGCGGNGGLATGRVQSLNVPNVGHLMPLENPKLVAESISGWLRSEYSRWDAEQKQVQQPLHPGRLHLERMGRNARL